jgi:hypothetical protein
MPGRLDARRTLRLQIGMHTSHDRTLERRPQGPVLNRGRLCCLLARFDDQIRCGMIKRLIESIAKRGRGKLHLLQGPFPPVELPLRYHRC